MDEKRLPTKPAKAFRIPLVRVRKEAEQLVREDVKTLTNALTPLAEKDWIKIRDRQFYYLASQNKLIPDIYQFKCGTKQFIPEFDGVSGRIMTLREGKLLFHANKDRNPLLTGTDTGSQRIKRN